MPIIGMEKQSEQFIFEELPLDMQKLIAVSPQQKIREIITTSKNISDAVAQFKDFLNQVLTLRSVSKSILEKFGYADLKQIVFTFLDELNKQFSVQNMPLEIDQSVRIANLLKNNQLAQQWLTERRRKIGLAPYIPIRTESDKISEAILFIANSNLQDLKQWLDAGYDPHRLLTSAIVSGDLPALKLLIAYGANINHQVRIGMRNKLLLSYVKELKTRTENEELRSKYLDIIAYLESEGAQE